MTNEEKLKEIFPYLESDDTDLVKVLNIDYLKSWWNAEYKEPITKNDLGVDCIDRNYATRLLADIYHNSISDSSLKIYQIINWLNQLPSVTPQEPQTFRWCTGCKEYDQEKHCCHRWSKVIRDTVEEIKQEQEPIKALGEELRKVREGIKDGIVLYGYDKAVAICDKYLSETEADNGNDERTSSNSFKKRAKVCTSRKQASV